MHILMVDDNLELIEIFAELLRRAGHVVRTVGSGEEGLKLLRTTPLPDVVVLDVDMPPGMSGPAMAHQMFLHDAGQEDITVVLVSGNEDLAAVAKRMRTPYWMTKPANLAGFLTILKRVRVENTAPASA